MTAVLLAWLLAADPSPDRRVVSEVSCATVADCWLDDDGRPIARPKKFKGRRLPKGDCGKNLRWLRNTLSCDETRRVCVALNVGDRC